MDDLAAAFLTDQAVLAVVRSLDVRRQQALADLRDAFCDFRDGLEDFASLEGRIRDHLTQDYKPSGAPPLNLWGFRNEEESRFATRLLNVARKVDGLDLDALFREHLEEAGPDEQRVQVLLGFGEFVAGLDAHSHAEGGARLGMGPATHFLTFAWHCLSDGEEPVFTYGSDRAIWALAQTGALDGLVELSRDWEVRLDNFYRVARAIAQQTRGRPESMRGGWAVEHVLDWSWARVDPTQVSPFTQPPAPSSAAAQALPSAKRGLDRVSQITSSKRKVQRAEAPAEAEQAKRGRMPKKTVKRVETRMFERSGISLDEALPPDRNPTPARSRQRPSGSGRIEPAAPPPEGPIKTAAMWMREKYEREQASIEARRRAIQAPSDDSEPSDEATPLVEPEAPVQSPRRELPGRVIPAKGAARERAPETRPSATRVIEGGRKVAADVALARELFLEPAHLGELVACLEERGRLLLVGPPLAGKTYLARRLAVHAAGHMDRVLVLRLHPEQKYEQLMGTRGLIRRLCEAAQGDREQTYALILDELDAGDAARALGEFPAALLERAAEVTLPSGAGFAVPRNLKVIATARSEPLDPAIVGRLPLVGVPSNPDVLQRYLEATHPHEVWVARLLDGLNARLRADGHDLAVGHGAFMDPELDATRARRIWHRTVLPLLRAAGVDTASLGYEALGGR